MGPDLTASAREIRYVNVGTVFHPVAGAINLDVQVVNRSAYQPADVSQNTIVSQAFAQINVACNTAVDLRVTILQSCTSGPSCLRCTEPSLSASARIECYAAGCDCWGTTVYNEASCSPSASAANKANYGCAQQDAPVVLPSDALVTITVFDFDTGPNCDTTEQLTVPAYEYFRTPLRPASDNSAVTSSIYANRAASTFTATACGTPGQEPTDTQSLTDDQASKGVQLFFRPQNGYVDATYTVSSVSSSCTGGNLLFAGDSALCAPPPPTPPGLPPSPLPPSLPPP